MDVCSYFSRISLVLYLPRSQSDDVCFQLRISWHGLFLFGFFNVLHVMASFHKYRRILRHSLSLWSLKGCVKKKKIVPLVIFFSDLLEFRYCLLRILWVDREQWFHAVNLHIIKKLDCQSPSVRVRRKSYCGKIYFLQRVWHCFNDIDCWVCLPFCNVKSWISFEFRCGYTSLIEIFWKIPTS